MVGKIIILFKLLEPFFWLVQLCLLASLARPKAVFEWKLKSINWLLLRQGFDVQLPYSQKAFKTWHRDVWILFFLNPVIIVLICLL